MKIDSLTNEQIGQYIPNVLTAVAGETPLLEKIKPFIDTAKVWLETEYLGSDDFLSERDNEVALKILMAKAMADAIPSLDMVVTPTGLAVISTDTLAPASRDRVERLIAQLRRQVENNIPTLLDICRKYKIWLSSERGTYYTATFLMSPSDVADMGHKVNYSDVRTRAIAVEEQLAAHYLGRSFMNELRSDYATGVVTRSHELVSLVISAVKSMLDYVYTDSMNSNRWQVAMPVIREVKYHEKYYNLWAPEMGDKFKTNAFENNVKGGFYF